jgi:hypothetical protein
MNTPTDRWEIIRLRRHDGRNLERFGSSFRPGRITHGTSHNFLIRRPLGGATEWGKTPQASPVSQVRGREARTGDEQ